MIISEINPTDHNSISACLFPDEVSAKLFLTSLNLKDQKDKLVEFSILRDYGWSKRHYCVHMIEFCFPILERSFPLFGQIAQMCLILPRWDLLLPRIPPPDTLLYSAITNPFWGPNWGYVYIHKTPPTPLQITPFAGLNLKVSKMNYSLGKMGPNWAKCLKSGQIFSRSQQIFCFHSVHYVWCLALALGRKI